jgi:hypothetical protein
VGPTSLSSPTPSAVVTAYVPKTRCGSEGPQLRHRRVRRPVWWWQPFGRRILDRYRELARLHHLQLCSFNGSRLAAAGCSAA